MEPLVLDRICGSCGLRVRKIRFGETVNGVNVMELSKSYRPMVLINNNDNNIVSKQKIWAKYLL